MNDRPTVFVVDDDDAVRKGLDLSLRERGYQVECFESAERFLDLPDLNRPGCLLLDVRMPGVTGLELQDRLHERGIQLPIIFISGHGDIPMTVRAMRKGAIDFLEKPYQLNTLLQRVEEALGQDQKNRSAEAENRAVRIRFERLTQREREVMTLIVAGAANTSNREVAEQLHISPRTVETYRARLMEKMQAHSLPELVNLAKICGVHHSDTT